MASPVAATFKGVKRTGVSNLGWSGIRYIMLLYRNMGGNEDGYYTCRWLLGTMPCCPRAFSANSHPSSRLLTRNFP